MSRPLLTTRQLALPLAIGLAMPLGVGAQTTTTTAGTASGSGTTSTASGNTSSAKLAASYAQWAGSTANARSLVNGLSNGTAVTLNSGSNASPGAATGSTSFSPSTGKMGVGEVNIALSLAKTSLAEQGITNPTPAQISAALNGGMVTGPTSTTSTPGVLSQRASGMGWGQIAQAMGVKLGSVVSASKTDKAKATEAGRKEAHKDTRQGASEKESHGRKSESQSGGGREGHGGGGGGGGKK